MAFDMGVEFCDRRFDSAGRQVVDDSQMALDPLFPLGEFHAFAEALEADMRQVSERQAPADARRYTALAARRPDRGFSDGAAFASVVLGWGPTLDRGVEKII